MKADLVLVADAFALNSSSVSPITAPQRQFPAMEFLPLVKSFFCQK